MYSVEELEKIVKNQSRCFQDSNAFQIALEHIRHTEPKIYEKLLYIEASECGGLD